MRKKNSTHLFACQAEYLSQLTGHGTQTWCLAFMVPVWETMHASSGVGALATPPRAAV